MSNIVVAIAFYIIAFICLVGAIGVVFNKKIVHSAAMLFLSFFGIAGLYVLLNADFVAMSQILIYSVGIAIIIIFAIMLTNPQSEQESIFKRPRTFISLICSFLVLVTFFLAIFINPFQYKCPSNLTINRLINEGTSGIIGKALFTDYVLPFEIISILLLVAIIGAALLARRTPENINEE